MKGKKNGSSLNRSRDIARSNYLKEKRKRENRGLTGKRREHSERDITLQPNPDLVMLEQIKKELGM